MIDDNTTYKALLKVNQIGKKISNNSKYILSNGIILGYSKQIMSDTEANPVSIGFIDKSILKNINDLGTGKGLLINGNTLYQYSKDYEFDSISEIDDGISINFIYYAVDDNAYIENFKDILRENKFSEDEIKRAEPSNFTINMDMYDLFLNYKKNCKPVQQKTIVSIELKYVYTYNFMYKKAEEVINLLNNYNLVYKEDIEREILDIIIGNNQPVIRKFKLCNGEKIKIRLMKSIFSPIASKNNASISIYNDEDDYVLCAKSECTGVSLFNIYRILKY